MIDLHTHILPCMDDGSASVKESEQMLALLRAQGAQIVVATPHYRATKESPQEFLLRREKAAAQLPQGCLRLGAEVAFFSGISHCEELRLLCIEGTKLLLLEMPFAPWQRSVAEEICKIRSNLGLQVVLAHIERYRRLPNFRPTVEKLLHSGVLLQCSADALCAFWTGRDLVRQIAEGTIHFIGTDCHNMTHRRPRLDQAVTRLEKKLGKRQTAEFFARARKLFESGG